MPALIVAGLLSGTARPEAGLRAAIYDDTREANPSAWSAGLDGLEKALRQSGASSVRLTRAELNTGSLPLEQFDVLLIGGGLAYPGYIQLITPQGKQRLRDAVRGGMGLVAVCAGAYFVSDTCVYDGVSYGDEVGYNLDLYPGPARGPVPGLPVLPAYGLAAVRFEPHAAYGEGCVRHLWYGSGPSFPNPPAGTTVLGRYHEGSPAVIALDYGDGRVVLWGAHAELGGQGTEADNAEFFARVVRWAARRS
ncbi:MAG: BPL-N domain-containing protein [Candidatus Eremiobacterota bacterium]